MDHGWWSINNQRYTTIEKNSPSLLHLPVGWPQSIFNSLVFFILRIPFLQATRDKSFVEYKKFNKISKIVG